MASGALALEGAPFWWAQDWCVYSFAIERGARAVPARGSRTQSRAQRAAVDGQVMSGIDCCCFGSISTCDRSLVSSSLSLALLPVPFVRLTLCLAPDE